MVVPLLLARGRAVSRLELADWLGDDGSFDDIDPLMADLRRRLAALGFRQALVNRDQLWRLNIAADQVDVHRLSAQVAAAGRLDDRTAAARLRAVVEQCAGEPLAGLTGRRIAKCRHALREERRAGEVALVRVECRLGRVGHYVPDLVRLSHERLADTEVVGLTMYALDVTGKRDEAVELYHRYHEHVVELGVSVPKPMLDLRTWISKVESH
ncbi:BTAD domain-containing putative transcriptional regulator [Actinophytocola sp. NPDC049390]|uniref:AfsR/SARP family transcriptional regulator n=1 Tax=Actinophytocola sp. NPDC049390 TaxID=3363894 RepID=UPI00379097AB